MAFSIGLDIGGTKIAGAVFSEDGEQCALHKIPTPDSYEAFCDACAQVVSEVERQIPSNSNGTIGIGLAGAIDHEQGMLVSANLPFLKGHRFRDDLEARLGRPVRLANDANCLALAEAIDGAGQGAESVLGLIMGTGIGGGFIHRGQIVDGPNGLAGEIGHLPLPFREESDGPLTPCGCGQKGCIEKAIAGPALAKFYAFVTGGAEKDAALIAEEARAGDATALKVLDRYYEVVAKAMAAFIHIFDPYVIVVSGGLNNLPAFYDEIPKRWGKYCYIKAPKNRLVQAKHGPMAGLRGAAFLGKRP